jgi:hypothetical protein
MSERKRRCGIGPKLSSTSIESVFRNRLAILGFLALAIFAASASALSPMLELTIAFGFVAFFALYHTFMEVSGTRISENSLSYPHRPFHRFGLHPVWLTPS